MEGDNLDNNHRTMENQIAQLIWAEQQRQAEFIEMIASENYQSKDVLQAQASVFANKYAEWFPGKRYYGGQINTDQIESLAIQRAKKIFHADHANVQALSWAAANLCVYNALMKPGDAILGMDLSHGWHLTHGSPVTLVSKIYKFFSYKTETQGEAIWTIDFDKLRQLAYDVKPKVLLAWFSAYPRNIDRSKFAEIAEEVGAIAFADVSHIWGFIAAGLLANPLDHGFQVMMTTTHKSLRWPRWAIILSKWKVTNPMKKPEDTRENIPTRIDRSVFPWVQWWPHMQTITAIAVALGEVNHPEFKEYAKQALSNAKTLADAFLQKNYKLVTGWTDNHMIVVDFSETNLNGRDVQQLLEKVGISSSASTIPDDPNPPYKPSGLRLGTPALTTRWVKEEWIRQIVDFIDQAIIHQDNDEKIAEISSKVRLFCKQYPLNY